MDVNYPSKRLALELALHLEGSGDKLEDLLERHDITASDLGKYLSNPVFRDDLIHLRDEVREKGLTFRVKARTMAEEMLKTTWQIVHDPAASYAVRADLIKSTVEWAGLKPKTDAVDAAGSGVKVVINFSSTPQQLDVTPQLPVIEHGA